MVTQCLPNSPSPSLAVVVSDRLLMSPIIVLGDVNSSYHCLRRLQHCSLCCIVHVVVLVEVLVVFVVISLALIYILLKPN